jgi:hypothetical protein
VKYKLYVMSEFFESFLHKPEDGPVEPKHVAYGYTINMQLCLMVVNELISN